MRGLISLTVVSVCVALSACVSTTQHQLTISDNDDASYRHITLNNGLAVVLVSDESTQKAAVSLDVYVGSGHDPKAFMGLAHFLEHMLFLGTEKYPQSGEYQSFISANGGGHNAFTGFEHTNYFFDIQADKLNLALDRFADFFVAPLFNQEYVEREKNAVESEYRARIKDEPRRIYDAAKAVVNPAHPFTQFSVGSLQTLPVDAKWSDAAFGEVSVSLQQALRAFHAKYYVAPNMRLAVYGDQPLDQLEAMVRARFQYIPSHADIQWADTANKLGLREANAALPPLFVEGQLPLQLTVEPEKSIRELRITFPVDPVRAHYREKPLAYIGHLLGYEGKGSLLSALKQAGLADSLSAGTGFQYRGGATFNVSIGLTEKGVNAVDDIMAALFRCVDLIREQGISAEQYDEQRRLADIAFRFAEAPSPMSRVIRLSSNMQYYPPEDVLYGDYRYDRFAPEIIARYLDQLTAENAQVTLIAPQQIAGTDRKVSPWFFAPYAVERIDEARLEHWQSVAAPVALTLPGLNPYVPSDLQVLDAENQSVPVVLQRNDQYAMTLWFQHDNAYEVPKADIFVAFKSADAKRDAREAAIARLYVETVKEQLNEISYPAYLVDTAFSLYPHLRGISLKVSGYDDTVPVLLEQVVAAMKQPAIDPQRFADIQQSLISNWENNLQATPYRRLSSHLTQLMYVNSWDESALIDAVDDIRLEDVQRFAATYFSRVTVDMLVHGNVLASEAESLADIIRQQLLTLDSAPSEELLGVRQLPSGVGQYISQSAHPDSAVQWYFQAPQDDLRSEAMSMLTADLIHPGFFDSLRTEQQLGYIVGAAYYPMHRWPGILLQVQSPDASATTIVSAMQKYIERLLAGEMIDQALFVQHRDALVQQLQEPDKTLRERSQRYWLDLARGDLSFERVERLTNVLSSMQYEEWQRFVRQVLDEQRASLIVAIGSSDSAGFRAYAEAAQQAGQWPVTMYP